MKARDNLVRMSTTGFVAGIVLATMPVTAAAWDVAGLELGPFPAGPGTTLVARAHVTASGGESAAHPTRARFALWAYLADGSVQRVPFAAAGRRAATGSAAAWAVVSRQWILGGPLYYSGVVRLSLDLTLEGGDSNVLFRKSYWLWEQAEEPAGVRGLVPIAQWEERRWVLPDSWGGLKGTYR